MLKQSPSAKKTKRLSWSEFPLLFKRTFVEYLKESTLMHSASLAYYTLFALLPLLYLSIAVFGRFLGNEAVRDIIAHVLKDQVGISDISGILEFLKTIDIEKRNILMEIIGIGALLFACSAFLISLKKSINEFFDLPKLELPKGKMFLNDILFRLIALVIIAAIGVIIMVLYVGETVLISMGASLFENPTLNYFYSNFLEHFTSVLMSFLIFSGIFKYVHDGVVKWRIAMAGAIVTALLLYVGQLLIKYYLANYFFAAEGGFAGTIFVLLAWVYYSAQIIFLGAKFTAVYAIMAGDPIKLKNLSKEQKEHIIIK